MAELPYTDEDRLLLNRWRGLGDSVLEQLCSLDERAISLGCRFSEKRRGLTEDRRLAIETRARLGVDHMERLPRLTYS